MTDATSCVPRSSKPTPTSTRRSRTRAAGGVLALVLFLGPALGCDGFAGPGGDVAAPEMLGAQASPIESSTDPTVGTFGGAVYFGSSVHGEILWASIQTVRVRRPGVIERVRAIPMRVLASGEHVDAEAFLLPGDGPMGTASGEFNLGPVRALVSHDIPVERGEVYRLVVKARMPSAPTRSGVAAVAVEFSSGPTVRVPFPVSWCVPPPPDPAAPPGQRDPCETEPDVGVLLDEANDA